MNTFTLIFLYLKIILVIGRDNLTVRFIKSFIMNEDKPTYLIYNGLCWSKKIEITMINEMSEAGIRSSSSMLSKSYYQDHNLLFLVDLTCPDAENVLYKATKEKLFLSPYRWLVLSNPEIVDPFNTSLWSSPILADSDLVLAEVTKDKFLMTELHRPSMIHTMQSTPRGYFNGTLVDVRSHRQLYRRRRNLMKHPLTMANVIQDNNDSKEHVLKEDRLDLQYDAVTKLSWIYAKHAFELLNAKPNYIFSYPWGYKNNGQWSGMINDIKNNKADLGTNCMVTQDRFDVVTYTDVVAPLYLRFIFRQPPLAYVSNIYSLTFSRNVWIAIAVCTASSTATLYLTSIWEAKLKQSSTQLDGSIGDALLLTLSALAQQGCFIEPKRAPGRIMEWVLFTALMALYAAYSANIVVLLQAPSNSIRTLTQLAASKITLAAIDVDYSRHIFSTYKDPTHVEIYHHVIPENGKPEFYDNNEGVERIRQGLFAFHSVVEPVYRRIEETFLESEKCDLYEVDFLNEFDGFMPVKKDSPYLELIRVAFKQIRESGIQSALIKRFLVPKPRCSNKMSAFSSVGLLDMQPVLIFMAYGIAVSVIILLAELICFKLSKIHLMQAKIMSRRRRK